MARLFLQALAASLLLPLASSAFGKPSEEAHSYWVGTIGTSPAQMELDVSGDKPGGSYFYDRTGIPLKLAGTLESDGTLRLAEQPPGGDVTGFLRGAAPSKGNGAFAGVWTAADGSKSLPFRFHPAAAFGVLALAPADDLHGNFRFPVLAPADDAATQQVNAELERFAREQRDAFLKDATAARADRRTAGAGGSLKPAWDAELTWEIHHTSSRLISLLASTDRFTGGAHGVTRYAAFNYRLEDGRAVPIRLSDLFRPNSQFVDAIAHRCIPQLREQDAAWVVNGQVKEFNKEELSTFLLRPDGITFVFAPYQVGPGAQGTFRVSVSYRDLKGVIDPDGPCGRFLAPAVARAKPAPAPASAEPKLAAVVLHPTIAPAGPDHALSEPEAVRLVAQLPEVRRYFAGVERASHGVTHAVAMGQGHGGDAKGWEVYVGQDRADGSICWNRFRVSEQSGAIQVWNAPSYNALIPLETWQRQQSTRAERD